MQERSSSSVRVHYPELSREEVLQRLRKMVTSLKARLPLVRVVLFGSYAKGNFTVGSDIDLLLVYRGPRRDDAYKLAKELMGVPRLEPHPYTEEEFQQLGAGFDRTIAEGIVLYEA